MDAGCDDFVRKPYHQAQLCDVMTRHLGLKFIRRQLESYQPVTYSEDDVLTSITMLPSELLERLEHAAVRGSMDQIMQLVEESRSYDAKLADQLSELASDFEYAKLLAMIQEVKSIDG